MNREVLKALAEKLALEARNMGCRGVIVALSQDSIDGEHSDFYIVHKGPCLEVEGLSLRVTDVVSKVWDGKKTIG